MSEAQGEGASQAQRLTDLEVRYAFLSDTVEQLSALVQAQYQQIDELKAAVTRLASRVRAQDDEGAPEAAHLKPPHY